MLRLAKKQSKISFVLLLSILFSLLGMISCEDVFENDIEESTLFLVAPINEAEIVVDSTVTLAWDFLDGATEYQVQLVNPDFENAGVLLLDSFTFNNQVKVRIGPGKYEWNVRGLNNGYSTDYFASKFTVLDTASQSADISGLEVKPLSPNGEINAEEVTFWWEGSSEIDTYQLQIVRPDFDNIQELLYDTTIAKEQIKLSLLPGEYAWRVRGVNENSTTAYSSSLFKVGGVTEIAKITLEKPLNESRINNIYVDFEWAPVTNAEVYLLEIKGTENFTLSVKGTKESVLLNGKDGSYEWNVVGVTTEQQTLFSDTLSFEYISGSPEKPVLLIPENNSSISLPLEFTWDNSLNSILGDSLFIYQADTTLVSGFPRFVTEPQYLLQNMPEGNYLWNVKTTDQDNRESEKSDLQTFRIQ